MALRWHELGETRVIPIVLRPVYWKSGPFRNIQALPPEDKPIMAYDNQDEAFSEIVAGIKRICHDVIEVRIGVYRSAKTRSADAIKHLLAKVFVKSGFPQITLVEPEGFTFLKLALQQPRRGVIIEGPSGIGKTTSVQKIINNLTQDAQYTDLSITQILCARNPAHHELLQTIREWHQGTVIIDDFHVLSIETRHAMVDYL